MVVSKTRLIYTAGTFSIPSEISVCRRVITLVSVLRRPPTQEYQNERSNPPKGFLGYVGFFINSYCERILPLEFDPQAILLWDNPQIQLYYTVLCTGINVVDALVALGAAMTPPAVLLPVTPTPSPFQGCPYTTLKFKLLFGTRLQIDTIGEEVVACAGITPEATIPDFGPPPDKYPSDRARSDDPARSVPEDGELPGDTAPATVDDPDLGLSTEATLRVSYTRGATPGFPDIGPVDVDYTLPNNSYTAEMRNGTPPGPCPSVQPQETWATSPTDADILLFVHNTCNALAIVAQVYV